MKNSILFLTLFSISLAFYAQEKKVKQQMIPMSNTYQKAYKLGSVYYKIGTTIPFTGILYGKYDNGNFMTKQEYINGIGNGKWTDYDPLWNKICEGTYKDNKVEGAV